MDFNLSSVIQTLNTLGIIFRNPQIIVFTLLSVSSAAVAATSAGSALSKSASHSFCFWDTWVWMAVT